MGFRGVALYACVYVGWGEWSRLLRTFRDHHCQQRRGRAHAMARSAERNATADRPRLCELACPREQQVAVAVSRKHQENVRRELVGTRSKEKSDSGESETA